MLKVLEEIPESQIFVIPVRLDECEIPDKFKKYQYADLYETNSLDKIIASISEHSKHAKPVRFPGSVHLDPVLQLIQGWPEVAKAAEKEMHELGLGDWQIHVRIVRPEDAPEDLNELPLPEYYDEELRMEFSVRPEPVVGKEDIKAWVWSIVDFLHQYVYQDDLIDDDLLE